MIETTLNGLVLELGQRECITCRPDFPGKEIAFPMIHCPKCKGTGKRGNGKCRNCSPESWERDKTAGLVKDYANPYVVGDCKSCAGSNLVPATLTDSLPASVMGEILAATGGIRLHLRQGELTAGESLMGYINAPNIRSLWTSSDYGRTFERLRKAHAEGRLTAELDAFKAEMTEKVTAERTQACKVATDDGVICSFIAVLMASNGYSVVGVFNRTDDERAELVAAEAARIERLSQV